jgi:hypothetical protein
MIIRLAAFLLIAVLSARAFAQVRPGRFEPFNQPPQNNNLFGGNRGLPLGGFESSSYDGPAEMRRRMMQQRRAKEQERREQSRKLLATMGKVLTEEELARSKFNLAHMLWKAGRIDSAKAQLAKLLDDYPFTETADRARLTLARL